LQAARRTRHLPFEVLADSVAPEFSRSHSRVFPPVLPLRVAYESLKQSFKQSLKKCKRREQNERNASSPALKDARLKEGGAREIEGSRAAERRSGRTGSAIDAAEGESRARSGPSAQMRLATCVAVRAAGDPLLTRGRDAALPPLDTRSPCRHPSASRPWAIYASLRFAAALNHDRGPRSPVHDPRSSVNMAGGRLFPRRLQPTPNSFFEFGISHPDKL
jgi:hypothetical protein